MSDRVVDPRIPGPLCEWSDLIQGVRTWAHALGCECGVYRGLGAPHLGGVCTYLGSKRCAGDVAANRANPRKVEEFRDIAAKMTDRAEYYRAALLFQRARLQGAAEMMGAIREAAAIDGAELEE